MATIGDGDYDFEYTYSVFGNLTSTTQDLTGLADDVEFTYGYDVLGRKTSVAATIGSTDDYVNTYSYDNLGRITQITQEGVSGGNAVAEKRVDFAYNDDRTRATISRFADLAGTKAVAETEKLFDELGRVTDIVHERAATEFADYDLTWDAASRITDFDFDSLVGDSGDAEYSYDDTNQLTASDYASDWQTDESYVYDDNGNRTLVDGSTSYTTGDHNRLTSDGTYNYTYDNEGNVLTKTDISTSESVEYTWDHRNRLVKVTFKNSGGTATKIVEYAYDHGQRWVRKTLDTDADGTIEESRVFVHDDGQIVLDFEKTGTGAASNSDLTQRYLWGTNVDELLTDELVDTGSEDDNRWALTDHLNSVRDLVVYDPVTQTVSVVKHVAYDAYGNVTGDSAPTLLALFRYTARPFDGDTGIQNNGFRWYDLSTGRWMSVDPIGFEAGDVNLYRYVRNRIVCRRDPFGLRDVSMTGLLSEQWGTPDFFAWYYVGLGRTVDLESVGLLDELQGELADDVQINTFKNGLQSTDDINCENRRYQVARSSGSVEINTSVGSGRWLDPMTVLTNTHITIAYSCRTVVRCKCGQPIHSRGDCSLTYTLKDRFANPLDWNGQFYERDEEAYDECMNQCWRDFRRDVGQIGAAAAETKLRRCRAGCESKYPPSEWLGATPFDITATWKTHFSWTITLTCTDQ